jgi:ATP-dependent helicase/nuclease subunit B
VVPQRHFLDWSRPLAAQAAEWLLARAQGGPGCPNLGSFLVLVPTSEAGRILRHELLRQSQRAALLPPDVRTPAQWLPNEEDGLASPAERLLAWREVLLAADCAEFPHLFPIAPERLDSSWAAGLAAMLERIQSTLLEAGWSMEDVARRGSALREPERWADLQRLESLWTRKLRQMSLKSPAEAWRAFAAAPEPPPGVQRVVLAGLPDPIPWTLRVLNGLAQVDVLVHAPENEAAAFDEWGRPLPSAWAERPLDWQADDTRLHVLTDESALAARAAALVRAQRHPGAVVVGLAREAMAPAVREALPAAHDPGGQPARAHEVWTWLDGLACWLAQGSLRSLTGMLRHPAGAAAWAARGAPPPTVALAALDRFIQHQLARTEADLAAVEPLERDDRAPLRALAAATDAWRRSLQGPHWLEALGDMVSAAWQHRGTDPDGSSLLELVFTELARQSAHARVLPQTQPADHLALTAELMSGLKLSRPRPEDAVEMKGWLELGWESRPHLILAGLQEGDVPCHRTGDVFLPETLRAELDLRTAAGLFARDAFLFQAAAAQRRNGGRLDVLAAKFTDSGEPLRPSRLLFQCTDEELPARAARVFQHPDPSAAAAPAPSPPRRLRLPAPPPEPRRRISVTHFSQFLESPLLFHLSRTLGWEETDPHKQEMDALDFGTLAHDALEALWREEACRTCTDAEKLCTALRARLEKSARLRYGPRTPLGVEVQLDALARRLDRFAQLQAAEAAAGWSIDAVEVKFEWPLDGWMVTGKIDRIDRHADGRVRLLDYKTSEKPTAPFAAHLRAVTNDPAQAKLPPQALFELGGKLHAWTNLQLPVYLASWLQTHPADAGRTTCGYIQLPRALQDVQFALWTGDAEALAAEATACARRVLAALEAGVHGPALDASCWKEKPWSDWMPGGPGLWIEC